VKGHRAASLCTRVSSNAAVCWSMSAQIDPWNSLRSRGKATESAGRMAQFGMGCTRRKCPDAFRRNASGMRTNGMHSTRREE
jgi:hypothetical protein